MTGPRYTTLPSAWMAPGHASGDGRAPGVAPGLPVRPVIQITVTLVLPDRLSWLLTAAAALLQALWHGR